MNVFRWKVIEIIWIIVACLRDDLERGLNLIRFTRRQHLCAHEPVTVGDTRAYIYVEQSTVERERFVKLSEACVSLAAESSAPKVFGLTVVHNRAILCRYAEKMQLCCIHVRLTRDRQREGVPQKC